MDIDDLPDTDDAGTRAAKERVQLSEIRSDINGVVVKNHLPGRFSGPANG